MTAPTVKDRAVIAAMTADELMTLIILMDDKEPIERFLPDPKLAAISQAVGQWLTRQYTDTQTWPSYYEWLRKRCELIIEALKEETSTEAGATSTGRVPALLQ